MGSPTLRGRRCTARPPAIRCDNGPELVSRALTGRCDRHGVLLQHIQPGKPNQNAYIKRLNRTYRREVLDAYVLRSLAEVRAEPEAWLVLYDTRRPRDSLGGVPPLTFLPRHHPAAESSFKLSTGRVRQCPVLSCTAHRPDLSTILPRRYATCSFSIVGRKWASQACIVARNLLTQDGGPY